METLKTKKCSKCALVKSVSEFRKRNDSKDGYRGECKECKKFIDSAYKAENRKEISEYQRKYRLAHSEEFAKYKEKYIFKNKDAISNRIAKWHKENADLVRAYKTSWKQRNKGARNSDYAKYRAAKLSATTSWSDSKLIKHIYSYSAELSSAGGDVYHVDHIAPLQGVDVRGLHVPNNLRVITAIENTKKHNHSVDLDAPSVLEDPGFHQFLQRKGVSLENFGINRKDQRCFS